MNHTQNLRELEAIQLEDTISAIEGSPVMFGVGRLDDTFSLWKSEFIPFDKEPLMSFNAPHMGIVDIKFNSNDTQMAISYLDSSIHIWDIDTKEQVSTIKCNNLENWRIALIKDEIVTAGELGKISFFNSVSAEKVSSLQTGNSFLNALAKSNDNQFLATGNNEGEVYITNLCKKHKVANVKPHNRIVRDLSFSENSNKLLTCSDDYTIKVIDINSEKIIGSLQGHKESVMNVVSHPTNSHLAFSCSFDKTVKCWDIREQHSVASVSTGSPLWTCSIAGNKVLTGGENGILGIYSLE